MEQMVASSSRPSQSPHWTGLFPLSLGEKEAVRWREKTLHISQSKFSRQLVSTAASRGENGGRTAVSIHCMPLSRITDDCMATVDPFPVEAAAVASRAPTQKPTLRRYESVRFTRSGALAKQSSKQHELLTSFSCLMDGHLPAHLHKNMFADIKNSPTKQKRLISQLMDISTIKLSLKGMFFKLKRRGVLFFFPPGQSHSAKLTFVPRGHMQNQ